MALRSIDPATGATLERLEALGDQALEERLGAADAAAADWGAMPIDARTDLLTRVAEQLRSRAPELARLITREMGKLIREAAVWTRDRDRGEAFARRMACGSAFVNGLVKSDPRLPFGGIKDSGYGRELGRPGIREFVNLKTLWVG